MIIRNSAAHTTDRRLLLGKTNGGRCLTLVIEATDEPGTWHWTACSSRRSLCATP